MDPLNNLPPEISLDILQYLGPCDLCEASQTCHAWHMMIQSCPLLWRNLCKRLCQPDHVLTDLQNGLSWKEAFIMNYGKNAVKKDWLSGKYSFAKTFGDLPGTHMCPMDVDTWGDILEMELAR